MFHDITFEYKGKTYTRTVTECMMNRFSMRSKKLEYLFEKNNDTNKWFVFNGPSIAKDLLEILSVELDKIKRNGGKVDKRRKGWA